MGRNRTEDEKDGLDEMENWISRRRIRVENQEYSIKI
jgi:hypothetical protein